LSKNKQLIENEITKDGNIIGIYHKKIDDLHPRSLKRVIENIGFGNTDVPVTLKGVKHVVEIAYVDNEVDVMILPYSEYRNRYGKSWAELVRL